MGGEIPRNPAGSRLAFTFFLLGYTYLIYAVCFQAQPGAFFSKRNVSQAGAQQQPNAPEAQNQLPTGLWRHGVSQRAQRPPAPAMPADGVGAASEPVRTAASAAAHTGSTAMPDGVAAAAPEPAAPPPPVLVGIVGGSGQWPFWQAMKQQRLTPTTQLWAESCTWRGAPLPCSFTVDPAQFAAADALYFHVPSHKGRIRPKLHPQQLRVAISLESAAYYSWLDDPSYMCQYDVEATYRSCSQVQQTFHNEMQAMHPDLVPAGPEPSLVHLPALPYEKKQHAVAYLNSNCGTLSPRHQIMQQWLMLGETGQAQIAVHSFGRCNNNMPMPQGETKMSLFRRYQFCIAMENSLAHDYITEKVWEALAAGCVPVYLGSPTIRQLVPEPQSVIVYGEGGNATSVEELDELLHRLGSDPVAYAALLAWKTKPLAQLSPGYQRYHAQNTAGSNECRLCQLVAQHRLQGGTAQYTTCLENSTWTAEAGMKVADCGEIRNSDGSTVGGSTVLKGGHVSVGRGKEGFPPTDAASSSSDDGSKTTWQQ